MIVISFFIFLLTIYLPKHSICYEYGFDNTETCTEYRQRRAKQLKLPCKEILELGYCLTAGNNYPWKAVNHFINENRGLMKRLYGKQEQFSMLSTELQSNFINQIDDIYDIKKFSRSPKYGRSIDDGKISNKNYKLRTKLLKIANSIYNTKFVYNTNLDVDNELPIIIKALNSNKYDESILDAVNMSIETNFLNESDIVTNTTQTTNSIKSNNFSMNNETQSLTINNQIDSKTKPNEAFTTTDFNIDLETTTLEMETTSYNKQIDNKPQDKIEIFETNDLDNELESEIETFPYEGVNACEVTEEVVAPYWANSTSGETLALLNTYPYEQYVHWEKCRSINQKMHCRKGCRCEQQHRLYRLLAYDPKNECRGIFMDWFKLPCCCICKCYDIPTKIKMSSRTPRGLRKETFYNFKKDVIN